MAAPEESQERIYTHTGYREIFRNLLPDNGLVDVCAVVSSDSEGNCFITFETQLPVKENRDPDLKVKEIRARNLRFEIGEPIHSQQSLNEIFQSDYQAVTETYRQHFAERIRKGFDFEEIAHGLGEYGIGYTTFCIPGINLRDLPAEDTSYQFAHSTHPGSIRFREYFPRHTLEVKDLSFYALADLVHDLPATDLVNAIRNAGIIIGDNAYTTFAEDIVSSPDILSEITNGLNTRGITSFKYLSHGRSGVFLEANTGEVVALRAGAFGECGARRRPVPQHHQLYFDFNAGSINVEVIKKLETKSARLEHLLALRTAVLQNPARADGKRFYIDDMDLRNVGLDSDGTPYYLDGDGIHVKDPEELSMAQKLLLKEPVPSGHSWTNPDGTWKQYTANQERHTAFDSLLHQRGGKLSYPLSEGQGAWTSLVADPDLQRKPERSGK